MLRLITNEVPEGIIDGSNLEFTLDNYISHFQSIVVDGIELENNPSPENDNFTLETSPTSSIIVSYFMREERDVAGDGTVTMGDLVTDIYAEIGREKYSRIYPEDRILREVNKTLGVLYDEISSRDRIQHYSLKGLNGLTVNSQDEVAMITTEESYDMDIEGTFITETGIYYDYYGYNNGEFTIANLEIIDNLDRIIVGHRIPYGVDKISEVYLNGRKIEPVDNREFNIWSTDVFTTITDSSGNRYLYVPYSSVEYDLVVKFIPNETIMSHLDDVVNLEYKYTRVLVYDICYRLLSSRDDDRWERYKTFLAEEKRLYKAYKSGQVNRRRNKIGIAPVYGDRIRYRKDLIPVGIYDEYTN